MAKGFNKLNISSAVKRVSNFDMSQQHLTTMDFGKLSILYHKSCIPRDKISYSQNIFSRVAPMNFPTYGNMEVRTATGFVPYYQVFDGIDNFFAGNKQVGGITSGIPYFTMFDFARNLVMADYDLPEYGIDSKPLTKTVKQFTQTSLDNGSVNRKSFDVIGYVGTQSENNVNVPAYDGFNFYYIGRTIYSYFQQLGYYLPFNFSLKDINDSYNSFPTWAKNVKLNALPILAFIKFYNDWFSQNSIYDSSVITRYLTCVKNRVNDVIDNDSTMNVWVDLNNLRLNTKTLFYICAKIVLMYDSDFITSAWRFPNAVINGDVNNIGSSVKIPGSDDMMLLTNNQTTSMVQTDSGYVDIPAVGIRMLQSFDKWIRRNNYSGNRDINRLYSRFGISISNIRSNYSYMLSRDTIPVQVGDVTNLTESSDSTPLGSYAGKAIANGQNNVNFDSDDYGLFLTIGYIYAKPIYYNSIDTENLRINSLDFYNPEFDGVGVQPITFLEVNSDPTIADSNVKSNRVFGFTERYNDMRFGKDQITGDFARYQEMESWHFGRDLTDVVKGAYLAQSSSVVEQSVDSFGNSEFDRIFALNSNSPTSSLDHFYLQCNFNVKMQRPIMNASQAVDLGDGDLSVNRNGVNNI